MKINLSTVFLYSFHFTQTLCSKVLSIFLPLFFFVHFFLLFTLRLNSVHYLPFTARLYQRSAVQRNGQSTLRGRWPGEQEWCCVLRVVVVVCVCVCVCVFIKKKEEKRKKKCKNREKMKRKRNRKKEEKLNK